MQITVEGYKAIAKAQTLAFDGLTILSGANSSGKSSFMQPFLILKQTIEKNYNSGFLELYGDNVKLTDSSQIVSKVPHTNLTQFTLTLGNGSSYDRISYKQRTGMGLQVELVELVNKEFTDGLKLKLGMKSEEIEDKINKESHLAFIRDLFKKEGIKHHWEVKVNKCFLKAELTIKGKSAANFESNIRAGRRIEEFVSNLIHVSGLRGNPERLYKVASTEDVFPGAFEKYVASIVSNWGQSKRQKDKKNFSELKSQLEYLGLASNIKAEKVDETNVEIKISRFKNSLNGDDCVNIVDVGFGVSQTLPVLVALLIAKKDQYVYIEQPELHLHPKAQFRLASIITSALNRGVKVVIETHSSILIRGIQIDVVKNKLDAGKVSLNWFSQDEKTGETNVSKAVLDEFGAFGDWPEDFDDITLKVEKMYLDAIEEKMFE